MVEVKSEIKTNKDLILGSGFSNLMFVDKLEDFKFRTIVKATPEWDTCSPASLRGHIVNAHFSPDILCLIGVARFDIELARHRGIDLNWVAKKACERLEESEAMILKRMFAASLVLNPLKRLNTPLYEFSNIPSYMRMLVRNLIYLEQLELARVDWFRVSLVVPDLKSIDLNIERDSTYVSFNRSMQMDRTIKLYNYTS